jgi:deoxyribonuclease V
MMEPLDPELWPTDPEAAIPVQRRLAQQVERRDRLGEVRLVAAVDGHYGAEGETTWAAAVLMSLPGPELEASALASMPTRLPYIPGYLSFREAPAMLAALSLLPARPDLLLVDGHGIAHPRRLGVASHVGVLADLPTIGVGKSRLTGRYEEPGPERGDWSPLVHRRETVGAVLRTRARVSPVFISTGHRVDLPTAIRLVLDLTSKYRLPDPIRAADALSRLHG